MLAGIILKAGAYGLHLVICLLDPRGLILFLVGSLAAVGSIISFFSGISCLDGKAIIAYSRVIHIA